MTDDQKVLEAYENNKNSGSKKYAVALSKALGVARQKFTYLKTIDLNTTEEEFEEIKKSITNNLPVRLSNGTCTKSLENISKDIKNGVRVVGIGATSACIYLLKCKEHYKIGVASSITARLATLQTGNPYKIEVVSYKDLEESAYSLEKSLHDKFSNKRGMGEWFLLDTEDVEYIKNLIEGEIPND